MSESSDKLLDLATTQLTNIIETAKNTAPKITETVLMITSYGNLIHVVTYFIVLCLSIPLFFVAKWFYCKWWQIVEEDNKERHYHSERQIPYVIGTFGCIGLGVLLFIIGFCNLLDFWSWVGIWHPDLYLSHEILQRLTESNTR